MSDESTSPATVYDCYPSYAIDPLRLDQAVQKISESLIHGTAHFLFGAGMSKDCRVPLGREVTSKLLMQYFPAASNPPSPERVAELARDYPLEAIATAIEAMPGGSRIDLTVKLKSTFFENLQKISDCHNEFAALCFWDGPQRVFRVFTTNFDSLLEDALGDKAKSIRYENDHEIDQMERNGLIPVIHLHGTLDGKYQITEADVFDNSNNRMHRRFADTLDSADAFIFVGYSLSDPDFRNIYMRYRSEIQSRRSGTERRDKTTFIIAPPDDYYQYKLGDDIWMSRGAIWIPLTALAFFKRLRYFLEHHEGVMELANLQSRYRITDPKAFADKVARVADILCLEREDALGFMMNARMVSGGTR